MDPSMDADIETMGAELIRQVQAVRLREIVEYVRANSPFYKSKFRAAGQKPADIKSVEDLASLPFTTREKLQKRNWEFLCVPKSKLVEIVETSGTKEDKKTSDLHRQKVAAAIVRLLPPCKINTV
jgi:phenylacetate-CoA ligase